MRATTQPTRLARHSSPRLLTAALAVLLLSCASNPGKTPASIHIDGPAPGEAAPVSSSAASDGSSTALAFEGCNETGTTVGDWRPSVIDMRAAILTSRVSAYPREAASAIADAVMACQLQQQSPGKKAVALVVLKAYGHAQLPLRVRAIEHNKRHFVRYQVGLGPDATTSILEFKDGLPAVVFGGVTAKLAECLGKPPDAKQPHFPADFLEWPETVQQAMCGF